MTSRGRRVNIYSLRGDGEVGRDAFKLVVVKANSAVGWIQF